MRKVCADFGAELREFNGEADHVHLLIEYPPKICVSTLLNLIGLLDRPTGGRIDIDGLDMAAASQVDEGRIA
jgi:hypothetical protein